jgi:hypothetical protein
MWKILARPVILLALLLFCALGFIGNLDSISGVLLKFQHRSKEVTSGDQSPAIVGGGNVEIRPIGVPSPSPPLGPPGAEDEACRKFPSLCPADDSTPTLEEAKCRAKLRKLGIIISHGPCVDVSDIVDDLETGTYLFNKPGNTHVDVPFHLALVLKTTPKQDVAPLLEGFSGQVTERTGKFAQSLEASLRGDDMVVEPPGMQVRTATTIEPVTWEWTVTPKAGGEKTLVIEVVANIEVGADHHKVQIKTLREPIQVDVSGFQQIKAYLTEANTFVLAIGAAIPALGAIFGLVPPARRTLTRWWHKLFARKRPSRKHPDQHSHV